MHHHPGPVMGNGRELGQSPLKERHMAVGQGSQQQGGRQSVMLVQVGDKIADVAGLAGLVHQVDGRPLLGAQGNVQGQFCGNLMVVQQVVANRISTMLMSFSVTDMGRAWR